MEANLDGLITKYTVWFHFPFVKNNPSERVRRFGRPLSGVLSEDHARLVLTLCHREEVRPE